MIFTFFKNMNIRHDYIGRAHGDRENKNNEKMSEGVRSSRKYERMVFWRQMERSDLITQKPVPPRWEGSVWVRVS